jgi:hypothetical protein
MVDNPGLIKTPEVETLPFVGSVSKLRTFGRSADYGAVAHAGARGWSSPPSSDGALSSQIGDEGDWMTDGSQPAS